MTQLTRRDFCKAAAATPAAMYAADASLPNIVYILADDLGWGDLGCYNKETAVPTPNANKFASQGMRFIDMHSPSAVCTPTRYGIMTGRYCWRSRLKEGVLWGYSPNLIESGRLTAPAMLKAKGYYTAGVGKWHLGLGSEEKADYSKPLHPNPTTHGFDYYFGIPASLDMDPYVYIENDRAVEQPTAKTEGKNNPRGVFWRGGPIAPHFKIEDVLPTLTDKAVSIIKDRAAKPSQPFFLYLALTGPHTPWVPKPEFQGKSKAGIYGDFVAQVDHTLGQVLRALDEAKVADHTLVIFTSDNGADWKVEDKEKFAHRANAGWKGEKADIWDAGHRIPFIARWPGRIKAGAVSDELGCLTDFVATAAEIVGAKLPKDAAEDSFNLLPALQGKKGKPIRDSIVHHSSLGMFSIRQGDWKLELGLGSGGFTKPQRVEPTPGGPKGQLYNIRKDPTEADNVWLQHPEIVAKLTGLLEKYQRDGHTRPM
ncbi:MAG TPA: arylsulfatase [Bryobacteraceae bacterium]|jgi:arylsulfatase A-like enzyme|nr:arylsulfatase [Bryobacteraceae bacterium]